MGGITIQLANDSLKIRSVRGKPSCSMWISSEHQDSASQSNMRSFSLTSWLSTSIIMAYHQPLLKSLFPSLCRGSYNVHHYHRKNHRFWFRSSPTLSSVSLLLWPLCSQLWLSPSNHLHPAGSMPISSQKSSPLIQEPWALSCVWKSFMLLWRWHQHLSGFLVNSHLPRLSRQSAKDEGDIEVKSGLCTYLLAFAL